MSDVTVDTGVDPGGTTPAAPALQPAPAPTETPTAPAITREQKDRAEELTAKAHAAHVAGDIEERDRLFEVRDALDGVPEEHVASVAEPLEAMATEKVQQLFAIGDEVDPEGMAELRSEWGNEAAVNFQYLARFVQNRLTPAEAQMLPDSPILWRIGAKLGRELHHGGLETVPPAPTQPAAQPKGQTMPQQQSETPEQALRRLTEAAHTAQAQGLNGDASRLFAERDALDEKIHGTGPIIGNGMRGV